MRSLVVLPSYNEAENVIPLIDGILEADSALDVLVVDDASPDGTATLVAEAGSKQPRVHLLRREGKLGLGSAYIAGFRFGLERDYERVLTMDCDFSHHPRYLPAILLAAKRADLVIGSRYVPGGGVLNWPLHRRALSRFANFYTRTLLRLPVRDCTAGFRCYRREVLESVGFDEIESSGYAFLEEMVSRTHWAGFCIAEVPIIFADRVRGTSKISQQEIYRAAWHVARSALRRRTGTRRTAPKSRESAGPDPHL